MNKKLEEMGDKLDVSPQDIGGIQKERRKGKFLYPLIGAVIVVCSTIVGSAIGKANAAVCTDCGGYPFAAIALAPAAIIPMKKKGSFWITTLVTLLVSVAGFIIAYQSAKIVYGVAEKYNVYKK